MNFETPVPISPANSLPLSSYEKWTLIISICAIVLSFASAIITIVLHRQTVLSARRTHSSELFKMWENVCEIDPNSLITPDLINAIHAIEFTAIYYYYQILDRKIICDLYKKQFIRFYEVLNSIDKIIPGTSSNCKDSIGATTKKVYLEMIKEGM